MRARRTHQRIYLVGRHKGAGAVVDQNDLDLARFDARA